MHESQLRNIRNMKQQGNMTSPKVYNSSITKTKDAEMAEMSEKEFRSLYFKMINEYLRSR
jgi:hypothetical protein